MSRFIIKIAVILFLSNLIMPSAFAGTWSDNFDRKILGAEWSRDTENFSMENGALKGRNAHPILILPLKWVEVGKDWNNYTVQCRVNVVEYNLLECTKGALVLRRNGQEGYVFALHVATKSIEVYRLSNNEMLLFREEDLQLKTWYQMRAELQGNDLSFYVNDEFMGKLEDERSPSGAVGLAVQDALEVLFDDFTITGPGIETGTAAVEVKTGLPTLWGNIKKR